MTNESYDYVIVGGGSAGSVLADRLSADGNGRELGLQGLAEYRETKHIWQNVNPKPSHWFEPPQAGVQQ